MTNKCRELMCWLVEMLSRTERAFEGLLDAKGKMSPHGIAESEAEKD